jgi:hypothetical protein
MYEHMNILIKIKKMKKIFTLRKEFGKNSLIKGLIGVMLFTFMFFTGCYEWRTIIQPDTATINSYFDVFLSAQDDGNPDNDWTNPDLHDYGLFGVMLPDGWTVQDSIPFSIICTDPEYNNGGILIWSAERSQTLEDSIPAPAGYYWWGAATSAEASMVYFDSLYIEPRIYTGSTPGNYFLRYSIGDIDYWDRNPADDVSDPIPITLIDNTGVEELLSSTNVGYYPNPATDILNIEISRYNSELVEFALYDITGKLVIEQLITSKVTSINVADLPEGIYMANLKNGQTERTVKVLIN